MKKIFIGIGVVLILLVGAFFVFVNPPRTDYYVQIDNSKYESLFSISPHASHLQLFRHT